MSDITLETMGLILNELAKQIHADNVERMWWNDVETGEPLDRDFGNLIALCHSELSEVLECDRKNLMDKHLPERSGVEVEFADLIIRVLDIAGNLGLDIGGALIEKHKYNGTRSDHKVANRKLKHGKKY